jgi:hypothetical protein
VLLGALVPLVSLPMAAVLLPGHRGQRLRLAPMPRWE